MAVGILHVTFLMVGCIAHTSVAVSVDRLSDLQVATHPASYFTCGDKGLTMGRLTKEQEEKNIISLVDCLGNYTLRNGMPNMKEDKVKKFNEILRRIRTSHWRLKRGVSNMFQPRKEVRMLSPQEWKHLTIRFNQIKKNKAYNDIMEFFGPDSINATNGGPAFLAWHRVLLLWVEFYLHQPLPYWDCTLDFHITDPAESILWTKHFFGNGEGTVRVGSFANFTESNGRPITRKIGQDGSLIARENLESLRSRKSNEELVYTTNIALEEYQNGILTWVGGTMSSPLTAPFDPVYFFVQCFIEKIWSDIRRNMKKPEEYPFDQYTSNPDQGPNEIMAKYPFDSRAPLFNKDGYTTWMEKRAYFDISPGETSNPLECNNPLWKRRTVLMWDNERRICVTGQGTSKDFNIGPDLGQTVRDLYLNDRPMYSPMPNGHIIRYVSPLKDMRTVYRANAAKERKNSGPKLVTNILTALATKFNHEKEKTNKAPNTYPSTDITGHSKSMEFGVNSRIVHSPQPGHSVVDRSFSSPVGRINTSVPKKKTKKNKKAKVPKIDVYTTLLKMLANSDSNNSLLNILVPGSSTKPSGIRALETLLYALRLRNRKYTF